MTKVIKQFFAITMLVSMVCSWAFGQQSSPTDRDPLLVTAHLEPQELSPGQIGKVILKMTLPNGFHAYEDQFRLSVLEPDGFLLGSFRLTPVTEFFDKFSKKTRKGMGAEASLEATIEAPPQISSHQQNLKLSLTYQACSDSFCLFPVEKEISIALAPQQGAPSDADIGSTDLTKILGRSLTMTLLFVFFAGVLTSFTPCIFPMIPITLAILGHESERRSRLQNFLLSVFYVHGIATTYSLLGVIAASSGTIFGSGLGNPWVLSGICVVFLVMSLGMYGLFELQVPAFIRNSLGSKKTQTGYAGAYVSGLIAGVVASPCVGPVLVTILTWVATTQNKLLGFVLLFTYAMGLGLIFLILGAFTELTRLLPKSGPWMVTVKFLMGSLMLGAFYYYLSLLLPERWFDGALGVGLIAVGSASGAFGKIKTAKIFDRLKKGFSQATLVIGIGYALLAAFQLRPFLNQQFFDPTVIAPLQSAWQPYTEENFQRVRTSGKPVIIDFWAEWCGACHELEQSTFSQTKVQLQLEKFSLLRFDATHDSPELRELKKKWKIQGLPTVIFVDSQGVWQQKLTLTEFERPDDFIQRLGKAQN